MGENCPAAEPEPQHASPTLHPPLHCPHMPPTDCGEGMWNCPGAIDPMGCMMSDSCVAEGEECPFHCPPMPPMDCGEGMVNCPAGMDAMGCMMPDMCVAAGDACPAF